MHQGKDHLAHVTISINRQPALLGQRGANDRSPSCDLTTLHRLLCPGAASGWRRPSAGVPRTGRPSSIPVAGHRGVAQSNARPPRIATWSRPGTFRRRGRLGGAGSSRCPPASRRRLWISPVVMTRFASLETFANAGGTVSRPDPAWNAIPVRFDRPDRARRFPPRESHTTLSPVEETRVTQRSHSLARS